MKKITLFLILFLLIDSGLPAQNIPNYLLPEYHNSDKRAFHDCAFQFGDPHSAYSCNRKNKKIEMQKDYLPLIKRPYDIISYDLYMDWFDMLNDHYEELDTVRFIGKNIIKIIVTENSVSSIELDSKNLNLLAVSVNNEITQDFTNPLKQFLILNLKEFPKKGDTINITIDYFFEFADSSKFQSGIWLFEKGTYAGEWEKNSEDSIFTEEKLVYTMSEPRDARRWMPCNDNPYDKAITSIAVKAPKDFTVASNGILDSSVTQDDATTFYWSSRHPMPTYLMHAVASKYHYWYDWYKRISDPNDSIKVEYYTWKSDFLDTATSGRHFNALNAFKNTVPIMEYLSGTFGEYPFDKYGQAVVQPFLFGGMEHQTITTLNRNYMMLKNYWTAERVIVHELAHQWIGDLMTCASWNDIWINEGGATWSEALWAGRYNISSYYNSMLGKRGSYLSENVKRKQPPIYAPPIYNVFNWATTYLKSAWFYHMLAELLGRDEFFNVFRQMLNEYAFKSLDTEDFKLFLESKIQNPPVDFDTFFDQWIYHAGHPVFDISMTTHTYQENKDYLVEVNLAQIQEGDEIPEVFQNKIGLFFFTGDSVLYEEVVNKEKNETFDFRMPFMPDSVKIDTLRTLCVTENYITAVKENKIPMSGIASLSPNPIFSGQIGNIDLSIDSYTYIEIALYNINGSMTRNIYRGKLVAGDYTFQFDSKELPTGVYSIIIKADNNIFSRKLIIGG